MKNIIFNNIEKIINHYLSLDPEVASELRVLSGKVFAIECRGLGFVFYIMPDEKNIHIAGFYSEKPDVIISGGPFSLFSAGFRGVSPGENIQISGDMEALQKLKLIFDRLDIDWEEQLSHLTGDLIAHQIGNIFRSLSYFGKTTLGTFQQNTTEYLQEELRYLPPREEVNDFMKAVDVLRNDVERLNVWIQRAKKNHAEKN